MPSLGQQRIEAIRYIQDSEWIFYVAIDLVDHRRMSSPFEHVENAEAWADHMSETGREIEVFQVVLIPTRVADQESF